VILFVGIASFQKYYDEDDDEDDEWPPHYIYDQLYSITKEDPTGTCLSNNSNCDNLVGVWSFYNYLDSVSYPPNGLYTYALSPAAVNCTATYQVSSICLYGYREDNGLFQRVCYWAPVKKSKTIVGFNEYLIIEKLDHGQYFYNPTLSVSGCETFRQLTTDQLIGNIWDGFSYKVDPIAACPRQPNGYVECVAGSYMRAYYKAHRQEVASKGNGYQIIKNDYSTKPCNITDTHCDWFAGTWNGYVISNSYSISSRTTNSVSFVPTSPSDVACSSEVFAVPVTCDNGYDFITGQFVTHCAYFPTTVYLANGTFFKTQEFNQDTYIYSFENGIRLSNSTTNPNSCIPMDRYDTDTMAFQFPDGFSGTSFSPNCVNSNISPKLQPACSSTGTIGTTSFAFLQRQRPISLVAEPQFSSSSRMFVSLFLLGFGFCLLVSLF